MDISSPFPSIKYQGDCLGFQIDHGGSHNCLKKPAQLCPGWNMAGGEVLYMLQPPQNLCFFFLDKI